MKHLLLILLFVPLISFGQKRTVTDLGVEQIEYGEKTKFYAGGYNTIGINSSHTDQYIPRYLAYYYYDGNPFNDNEKSLNILNIIKVTKSEISEEKITFYPFTSKPFTYCSGWNYGFKCPNNLCYNNAGRVDETCTEIKEITYEFIFDNDRSTYFKLDSNSAKNIKSLDHELFLKFKKHNNVILRSGGDYKINLSGFTAAYNKYMDIETPTIKNKNLYRVANGLANVNPFNLDKYIDKFILDAKTNHNIDLSYVNQRDRLILFRELEGETIAAAYKMDDDDSVLVLVDPENWYDANQSKRWYIIYHELGHDILNLEHGECGPMMNERASGNYTCNFIS